MKKKTLMQFLKLYYEIWFVFSLLTSENYLLEMDTSCIVVQCGTETVLIYINSVFFYMQSTFQAMNQQQASFWIFVFNIQHFDNMESFYRQRFTCSLGQFNLPLTNRSRISHILYKILFSLHNVFLDRSKY